jgi:hypothetical protein
MDHKIGDLVVDYEIRPIKEGEDIYSADPRHIVVEYTFGIIVGAEPIDLEDDYYKLYLHNFHDYTSYSILWADYEHPIHKYSTDHIAHFKKDVIEIEKEMDEKSRTKQENK